MPEGVEDGILKGLYRFRRGEDGPTHKAHILGSGPLLNHALRAQAILAERYDVSADVWSATSYKLLRNDALAARRWNMLHPEETPRVPHVEWVLGQETGPVVAVSDYMKIVPDQIAPFVRGGLVTLGTDGFGRSDTRGKLRRFFEVDQESIVIATLYSLARQDRLEQDVVTRAIRDLDMDPEKAFPILVQA
jgi:pyruvate dehydrogenase E1 component